MRLKRAVEVYREVMEEKDLGRALNSTERIGVFLDPRTKMMSEDDCIGGGNALQTMAISAIEELEDITSSGTSRRLLEGHQPLHQLQPLH